MKHAWPIFPSVIAFTALAGTKFLRAPRTPKQALKEAVHTMDSIAAYVKPTMAGHNDRRGGGCTHAHPVSRASRGRATPTRSCFWLFRMGFALPEFPLSVTARPPIMCG